MCKHLAKHKNIMVYKLTKLRPIVENSISCVGGIVVLVIAVTHFGRTLVVAIKTTKPSCRLAGCLLLTSTQNTELSSHFPRRKTKGRGGI